jgi:hypothetical protein
MASAELVGCWVDEDASGVGRVVDDCKELVGVEHVVRRLDLLHHLRHTVPAKSSLFLGSLFF